MKRLRNEVIIDPYFTIAFRATDIEAHPEYITLLNALKVSLLSKGYQLKLSVDATIAKRTALITHVKTMSPLVEPAKLESYEFVRLKRRDITIDSCFGMQRIYQAISQRE